MRIAIVSDIHGNRTALNAIVGDLGDTSPDLVCHGGDLAHGGSRPAEVIDQVRDLGWQGVMGNADEMYTKPESLREFMRQSSAPAPIWTALEEITTATRTVLGEDRISWMRSLPRLQLHDSMAVLHASPESVWRSPGYEATDAQLEDTYAPLGKKLVVFGHIHWPFVRTLGSADRELTVANAGSVSLSYDGDSRAAYLLIDGGLPTVRRVEYDVEKECRALSSCGLPHAEWVTRMLRSASPQMP